MHFLFKLIDPLTKLLHWDWMADIEIPSILLRLFLAILCGGIIGIERTKKHYAAGLRTYIIVCVGATIAMMTNEFIAQATDSTDMARMGAQVVSGIGFLGAGTILITSRSQIKGLTTAAGLWGCACLGLAIGVGYYTLAILGAILIMVVISILPKIEGIFIEQSKSFSIHIELKEKENLKDFVNYVRSNNFKILSLECNQAYSSSGLSVYSLSILDIEKGRKTNHAKHIEVFSNLPYVNYVEEIIH